MPVPDLLESDPPPETLVRRGLALLEREFRAVALAALWDWASTGLVAPELFSPLAGLQRPSWGTWNGLLDALRAARRRFLRAGKGSERTAVERAGRLARILRRLDEHVEDASGAQVLARHHGQSVGERPRLLRVLALAITLRNRVAHDAPSSDAAWTETAAAFRPLLEWYARQDPLGGLVDGASPASPFFAVHEGTAGSFNGLDEEARALYVTDDGRTWRDEVGGREVVDCFRRLLGQEEARARDFRSLLGKLAPQEIKGVWMGDYLVGPPIGEGGFGRVHLGRQLSTGRQVAIKILYDGTPEEVRHRFHQESRYLARFQHPHIVQVIEHGRETWCAPRGFSLADEAWYRETFADTAPLKHFIAMEWVEGRTIEEWIRGGPRPDVPTLVSWFADAANALATVHAAGLVHRDVKPSNLMVSDDGSLKLMDFGIARSQAEDRTLKTTTGRALGTPAYMSPEQLRALDADAEVGPSTDVYSLCATFYEAFSGRRLYAHDRESEATVRTRKLEGVAPDPPRPEGGKLPWEIETLVLGGLESEVADRPASMQALEADLRRTLRDEPIRYRRPSWIRRTQLAYRRHRTVTNLVAFFALAGVVAAFLYVQGIRREQARTEIQRRLAVSRESESRARLARVYVRSGTDLYARDERRGALLWFAKALGVEADDPARAAPHRLRVTSLLEGEDRIVSAFRGLEPRETEPLVISDALLSPDGKHLGLLLRSAPNVSGGQIPCSYRLEERDPLSGRVLATRETQSLWYPDFELRFLGHKYLAAFDPSNKDDPAKEAYRPDLEDYVTAIDLDTGQQVESEPVLLELLRDLRANAVRRPARGARYATWHADVVLVCERPARRDDVSERELGGRANTSFVAADGSLVALTHADAGKEDTTTLAVHLLDPVTLTPRRPAWTVQGVEPQAWPAPGCAAVFVVSRALAAGDAPVPFPKVELPDDDFGLEPSTPVVLERRALDGGEVEGRWVLPAPPRGIDPAGRSVLLEERSEWMYGPRWIFLFDLATKTWRRLEGGEFEGEIEDPRYTSDGRWMWTTLSQPRAWGGGACVWTLADARERTLATESVLRDAVLDREGRTLAASYEQSAESRFGLAHLFDLGTDPPRETLLPQCFQAARFSDDGSRIATAEGRRLRIWKVQGGAALTTWFDHPWPAGAEHVDDPVDGPWVYALAWSPDGRRLATACGRTVKWEWERENHPGLDERSTVVVWDAATGLPLSRPFETKDRVEVLAFDEDGGAVDAVTRGGAVLRFSLVSDPRPAEVLLRQAELYARERVDESETLVDLTSEELLDLATPPGKSPSRPEGASGDR